MGRFSTTKYIEQHGCVVKNRSNGAIGRGPTQDKLRGAGPPQVLGAKVVVPTVDSRRVSSGTTAQPRIDDKMEGWTGMQVHYLCVKKKKKKKKSKTVAERSKDKAEAYLTDEGQISPELDTIMTARIAQYMMPPPEEEGMGPSDAMAKDGDADMTDDV